MESICCAQFEAWEAYYIEYFTKKNQPFWAVMFVGNRYLLSGNKICLSGNWEGLEKNV